MNMFASKKDMLEDCIIAAKVDRLGEEGRNSEMTR
jgi:hypothetical protein